MRGKVQESARVLKHALTLDPNHPEALRFRAVVLSAAGQESTVEATRLLEVDPLSPFNQIAPAWGTSPWGGSLRQWICFGAGVVTNRTTRWQRCC